MSNPETPNRHTDSPDNPKSWGKAGDLSRAKPEALNKMNGREGAGESGGGAYPNPHTRKGGSDREGYMGSGGQTGMSYEGPSNANEPTTKTKPEKSRD